MLVVLSKYILEEKVYTFSRHRDMDMDMHFQVIWMWICIHMDFVLGVINCYLY